MGGDCVFQTDFGWDNKSGAAFLGGVNNVVMSPNMIVYEV